MRSLRFLAFALLATTAAWSLPKLPIVFQDELASQNPSDVIGDPDFFDIDNLTLVGLTRHTHQDDIRFNFGGGAALTPFSIGSSFPTLSVGDLFFRTPTNTYAVILNGHDGLVTNGLYQISSTQAARDVLGNPAGSYRPDAQVWAAPGGAQLLSTGSASISTVNNVSTFLRATLFIQLNNAIISDLDNGFSVYFAAATCGNDEITGNVPPTTGVPEPGTWAMLGAGLIATGLLRRSR